MIDQIRQIEQDAHAVRGALTNPERAADVGDLLRRVGHLALGRSIRHALHEPEQWDAEAVPQALEHVAEPNGRHGRQPVGTRGSHEVGERLHHVVLELAGAQAALDRRPPAAVAEPGQRPAGVDARVLGDLAHEGEYLPHQITRWLAQLASYESRELPSAIRAAEWLRIHRPPDQPSALFHGDYKLDNVLFAPESPPRIAAVVDWEMAGIGDPLVDLAWALINSPAFLFNR